MDTEIKHLYRIINKSIILHEKMFELVTNEEEAICNSDLELMTEISSHKEELTSLMKEVEKERLDISNIISSKLNFNGKITLSFILKTSNVKEKRILDKLKRSHRILNTLVKNIKYKNDINKKLIEKSLFNIMEMKTNVLKAQGLISDTYNSRGRRRTSVDGRNFVSKEV